MPDQMFGASYVSTFEFARKRRFSTALSKRFAPRREVTTRADPEVPRYFRPTY